MNGQELSGTCRTCIIVAALFAGLLPSGRLAAQAPTLTLVKAGRLIDPRTGNGLSPAAVLLESSKIKEVGQPTQVQAHASGNVRQSISAAQLCCRV